MMMGVGLIGVILVIIVLIVLVAGIVGWRPQISQYQGQRSEPPSETPREILEKRYARGEIDKDEFDRISKEL